MLPYPSRCKTPPFRRQKDVHEGADTRIIQIRQKYYAVPLPDRPQSASPGCGCHAEYLWYQAQSSQPNVRFRRLHPPLPQQSVVLSFIQKMIKSAGRIAAATHTGNHSLWIFRSRFFFKLPFYLLTDYALKPRHHIRIRMRTHYAADDIMGIMPDD